MAGSRKAVENPRLLCCRTAGAEIDMLRRIFPDFCRRRKSARQPPDGGVQPFPFCGVYPCSTATFPNAEGRTMRGYFFAIALPTMALLVTASRLQAGYDPLLISKDQVEHRDLTVKDENRSREIPIRI